MLSRFKLASKPSNDYYLHCTTRPTSQQQATVKLHGVFTSHWKSLVFAPEGCVRGILARDSGHLVTSFMRVVIKTTRYCATASSMIIKNCLYLTNLFSPENKKLWITPLLHARITKLFRRLNCTNQLSFRYLKRIIVIPAVYQILAPLKRSLNYWHWADVTFRTHLHRLAKGCVFVKQSGALSH